MHSTAFVLRLDRKNAVDCINCSMMSGNNRTQHDGVFRPFVAKLQITDSQLFLNTGTVSIEIFSKSEETPAIHTK